MSNEYENGLTIEKSLVGTREKRKKLVLKKNEKNMMQGFILLYNFEHWCLFVFSGFTYGTTGTLRYN